MEINGKLGCSSCTAPIQLQIGEYRDMRCPICLGDRCFKPSPDHWGIWICDHCYRRIMIFEPKEIIPKRMMKLLENHQSRKLIHEEE